MHEVIVHIASGRSAVGFRAEAGQALLVDVDAHRADSVDQNVDAQIVLQIVDQVRSVYIVLDHPAINTFVLLSRLYIFQDLLDLAAEENAPPLRQAIRLHNVRQSLELLAIGWLLKLILEVDDIAGEHPGLREKVELLGEGPLHAHQVPRQVVLLGDRVHARVVIHLLVRAHLGEEVRRDGQVVPRNVPVFRQLLVVLAASDRSVVVLLVLLQLEAEHLAANLLYHVVLCAIDIHHKSARFFLSVRAALVRIHDSSRCIGSLVLALLLRLLLAVLLELGGRRDVLVVVVLLVVVLVVAALRLGHRLVPAVLLLVADRCRRGTRGPARNEVRAGGW